MEKATFFEIIQVWNDIVLFIPPAPPFKYVVIL